MENVYNALIPFLRIKAMGRGSYKRTLVTKFGFARGYYTRNKRICGFQTGDVVKAMILKGSNAGTHVGRVVVRASRQFDIWTQHKLVAGISHRNCRRLQRSNGYRYFLFNLP